MPLIPVTPVKNLDEYFSCSRKVQYATLKLAKEALVRVRRSGEKIDRGIIVYKCKFCFAYHVGHNRRKEAKYEIANNKV